MNFESPAALWGLASLALLLVFSLWRQGAQRVTVPSILLWKRIPERNPPVRALRRPRWRFELLLQALAVALLVGALAGPYRETSERKPLRVALVFDSSARMRAADRLDRAKDLARRLIAGPLRGDDVTCYASSPSPRCFRDPGAVIPVDVHVDLDPLLAAARAASDRVILFSDRPREGAELALLGAPADNAGIVELGVGSGEVFVRLVNHGPPRPLRLRLETGARSIEETLPPGRLSWSTRAVDLAKASFVRVSLVGSDSFDSDDVAEADRLTDLDTTVSVTGRIPPQLIRALRSIPGVTVRMGEQPARLAIGVDAPPGPGDLRVWLVSPAGPAGVQGEVKVASHPLVAELDRYAQELRSVVGFLPESDRGGEPLLSAEGKVVAALRGRELRLAVDVAGWGKGLVSLPIFFVNAVDAVRRGSSGLAVLRTGRPMLLPPGSAVESSPKGAVWSLSSEGWFVAHTAGPYGIRTPEGLRTLRANLLDERESDSAGETRPLKEDLEGPAGRIPVRRPLAGAAAGLALALLVLAWILQLRSE